MRIRILGICLERGRTNTVVAALDVDGLGGTEEGSMCPTYLFKISTQKRF